MPSLRKEIQDVVDEVTGAAHAGEPVFKRLAHAAVELTEAAGVLYQSFDDVDRAADLAALSEEAEDAANEIVDKLLADRPMARRIASAGIPMIVGPTIDALAEHSGTITTFIETKVLPFLREAEDSVRRVRVAFGE